MHETTRTLAYVGLAAISLAGAYFMAPSTPRKPDEFVDVGTPFYKDFAALDAKYLEVVTFNEDTATPKDFRVEFKDGLWRIASHRNYPADGKDRLAKTAASIVGINREEFKSRSPDDYVGLGVIDPKDEDATKLKGRGQRIILKDAENQILADYIIGKQVKSRPGYYYVRKPDEKSVYVAKLDKVDLSTKFSDWIEADLLKVQPDQIREIVINKYSVDEAKQRLVGVETSKLAREKSADPWKLEGLDEATEEVNADDVRTMLTALDDLKIVGARPKPAGLSEDLKLDQGIRLDAVSVLDLQSRGFYATQDRSVVAKEGAVVVGTDQGVLYTLQFGAVFTGSDLEAEVGLEADNKTTKPEEKDKKPEDAKGVTQNRYLLVRAAFDPTLIGPAPARPSEAEFAEAPETPKPETPEPKPAADPEAKPPASEAPDKKEEAPDKAETPKKNETPTKPDATDEAKPEAGEAKPEAGEAKPETKPEPQEGTSPETKSAEPESAQEPKSSEEGEAQAEIEAAEPATAQPEAKSAADESEPAADKPAADKPEADDPAEEKKPADEAKPAEEAKPAAEAKLSEAAQKKFDEALKKYETDQKAYEEKLKKGEEQVQELNQRFADWYYVISADSFNKLRLSRAALVKPKAPAKTEPDSNDSPKTDPAGTPDADDAPEDKAPPASEKPDAGEPGSEKPEPAKPEAAKPAPDKPAPDKPDADKPDAAKPESPTSPPETPDEADPEKKEPAPSPDKPQSPAPTDGAEKAESSETPPSP